MKVLFVVDVHTSRAALEWIGRKGKDYDAIIVGGDIARSGGQDFVSEFLDAVASTGKTAFFVPGNADSSQTKVPTGVVPLHGRTATVGKHTIGGLGGSNPTPFHTIFELEDADATSILSRLGRLDILVSHCPPVNTKCDRAGGAHIGSAPVREYIIRERPYLVLSGHAHDSRGIDKVGDTTIVNPGPLMRGNYAEVRLDGLISVELKSERL
ncbi:MAG: metallophosphoesterase family protein [Nitrososphaerales archaeon]|nr:metallophosphoesterase family protein [Nitrososphaerales archaeon]